MEYWGPGVHDRKSALRALEGLVMKHPYVVVRSDPYAVVCIELVQEWAGDYCDRNWRVIGNRPDAEAETWPSRERALWQAEMLAASQVPGLRGWVLRWIVARRQH